MIVNLLIAFGNIISLSASILIVSAHSLIGFEKAIRLSARIFIASTLPSDIACSPIVPGGDTPCLTAGDARRANPWRSDAQTSDTGGVAQQLTSARQSYPSTLSVRRLRRRDQSCLPVHGFPLALLGYHPRLRMVRLHRRRLCVDADAEEVQWVRVSTQAYIP